MTEYRRTKIQGATYFFTVNCAERRGNRILENNVDALRQVFRKVKQKHPFEIDAIVILPEHLHCIWTLPQDDADYSLRWNLIKSGFSRLITDGERLSESRIKRGERGIWQRRFWEHMVRDEKDFERHVDYIHWNPVKHGCVKRVRDWPYSSFHSYVRNGVYPVNWASDDEREIDAGE